jgi:glycosyltransferase involved in cell wall biosynthesis
MSITLSIVTITYNDLNGLRYTLDSFGGLPASVEYLIVDGNSNDGTKEFLSTLPEAINWSSEPDKGLYDAMNKGLARANGDYIIFMNSGDGFYTKETLNNCIQLLNENKPDVLFGETMYRDENNHELGIRSEVTTRKLPKALHWKNLINGMLVCHQSYIVKRSLAGNYLTDNLSADIDWMIETLKKSTHILPANMIIANYLVGGVSTQQHQKSLKDRFKVFVKHFGLLKTLSVHVFMVFRHVKHKLSPSSSSH